MDCRRRSAVDDDRSRRWVVDDDRYPWAVDEDRRQIRWAVDEDRHRRRCAIEEDRRRRRRAVDCEEDDYSPLQLPLSWRDPPPHYPHKDRCQRRRAVNDDRRREALRVAQVKASIDRIDALCVNFMHSVERIMSRSTTIPTPSLVCSSNTPGQPTLLPPADSPAFPVLQRNASLELTEQSRPEGLLESPSSSNVTVDAYSNHGSYGDHDHDQDRDRNPSHTIQRVPAHPASRFATPGVQHHLPQPELDSASTVPDEQIIESSATALPILTPSYSLYFFAAHVASVRTVPPLPFPCTPLESLHPLPACDQDPSRMVKNPMKIGELMKVQMKVFEPTYSQIWHALLRIVASQLERRAESIILPLKLIQQFIISDFSDQQGLIQSIRGASKRLIEAGNNLESMLVLHSAVMPLASRSVDGFFSNAFHWVDGSHLNLHLYPVLLETCFDHEEGSIINGKFESNLFVQSSVIDMYASQLDAGLAYKMFEDLPEKNIVEWTAITKAYGDVRSVVHPFKQLEEHHVILWGIIEFGDMTIAKEPFSRMLVQDSKSWNSILLDYTKEEVCESFFTFIPDKNVKHARWIHLYHGNNEFRGNVYIEDGLIDMYTKCDCINSAINVFTTMKKRALDLSTRMEEEDFLSAALLSWANSNEFVDMHQRHKVFDPGGLIIISTASPLPTIGLDGVELFDTRGE